MTNESKSEKKRARWPRWPWVTAGVVLLLIVAAVVLADPCLPKV